MGKRMVNSRMVSKTSVDSYPLAWFNVRHLKSFVSGYTSTKNGGGFLKAQIRWQGCNVISRS